MLHAADRTSEGAVAGAPEAAGWRASLPKPDPSSPMASRVRPVEATMQVQAGLQSSASGGAGFREPVTDAFIGAHL